jgi:glutaredoxin
MSTTQDEKPAPPSIAKRATAKLFAALNRADELGGEVRDFVQERVLTDERYVKARKRLAGLFGKSYESKQEAVARADRAAADRAAAASTADAPAVAAKKGERVLGDPALKAQLYGKKSCPWSGRAITLLERHKVDFDWVDLEEPEHEPLLPRLMTETKQHTVPFVYLRGQFVGGFNALSEIERLGQLEFALMSAEERKAAPAHLRSVEIVARPNTDEVAPAEVDASRDAGG